MIALARMPRKISDCLRSMPRTFWVFTLIYFFINAWIFLSAAPGASLTQGGDAGSYWSPALAFLKYGDFVRLDNPTELDLYRTPLYPLMISMVIFIFGENPSAVVLTQIFLLYAVGILYRNIVKSWLPSWRDAGMALIILNPNLIGTVHLIQSETLYLFFISIGFWSLLRIVQGNFRLHNALIVGVALAFACLVKPTSQFLVITLPIFLPLIAVLSGSGHLWGRLFIQGTSAAAIAIAIMAPWAIKLAAAGNGYSLSEYEIKYRFLWDQVVMLEANLHGIPYHEAEVQITSPGSFHAKVIASQGEDWHRLSDVQKFAVLERYGYEAILSYPPKVIVSVIARSVFQFIFSGGAGNLHNIIATDTALLNRIWFKTSQKHVKTMLDEFVNQASLAAIGLSLVAISFVCLVRLIGLLGICEMWRRGEYTLLITLAGIIGYFIAVHLFHGNSRYRVPVEPAMMIFTLYGLQAMSDRYRSWLRN